MNDGITGAVPAGDDADAEVAAMTEVRRTCDLLLQLPIQWGALLEGINPKTHLANVTGLSKSRIAEGSLDQLRSATVARAGQRSLSLARGRALESGVSEREFDELVASAPRLADGLPSHLGGMFHFWASADEVDLTETIAQAAALEGVAAQLHAAAAAGDWAAARRAAQDFLRSNAPQEVDLLIPESVWMQAEGWKPIRPLLDRVLMNAYATLLVILDAEWGAQYFKSLRPQPVLPWLAPEVALDADGALSRRNGIRRPVRKLLELSFVIAERRYSGRWPSGVPGRSEVGAILEQSDAHVGNYFDGTRKLTWKAFDTWWLKLTASMRQRFGHDDQMAAPTMLARVALLWQGYWVKEAVGEPRSIIVLDQSDYRRRWQAIRRQLSARFPEGQGDWPVWFTAQASSSSLSD